MPERTIAIRAFPYYVDVEDPITGDTRKRERIARRGETVDLREQDVKRGEKFGAFQSDAVETESGLDLSTASSAELAEWIESDSPTVQEVVDAAGDDPARAQVLLDAENVATGNNPRKGVVDGLGAVAERGNQ